MFGYMPVRKQTEDKNNKKKFTLGSNRQRTRFTSVKNGLKFQMYQHQKHKIDEMNIFQKA